MLTSLVLLCSALAVSVVAQFTARQEIEMHCNNSTHPPDWPQNCIDAYNALATNVSSFSPEDRRALIQYLDEACPDCHNSFVDFYILCGKFDETVGEFWRNTYCLRDDVRESNEYCQVIIYDLVDTTTMDEEYSTECADLRSGGTVCSSGCRDVLMRTQNYLGCCTCLYGYLSTAKIDQGHYDICNVSIPKQCGSAGLNCDDSAYPPDWPQNCIDAYKAHATNVSSFSPEDRKALVNYLNVTCPDCHNSFMDYNLMCGRFDEAVGEFWRSTYCLRDDVHDSEYCQVIIYDLIDTTTMDEEYITECANLQTGGINCSVGCRDVLMRTQEYLGCCTHLYGYPSVTGINQTHYDICDVSMPKQCGSIADPDPSGYVPAIRATSGFILITITFFLMTLI